MSARKCLFDSICDPLDYIDVGCPFVMSPCSFKKNVVLIKCPVWHKFRESRKERRLCYAEEEKHRREIQRSRGQDGTTEAGEGHPGFEVEEKAKVT